MPRACGCQQLLLGVAASEYEYPLELEAAASPATPAAVAAAAGSAAVDKHACLRPTALSCPPLPCAGPVADAGGSPPRAPGGEAG
jgi:hypothetical protein